MRWWWRLLTLWPLNGLPRGERMKVGHHLPSSLARHKRLSFSSCRWCPIAPSPPRRPPAAPPRAPPPFSLSAPAALAAMVDDVCRDAVLEAFHSPFTDAPVTDPQHRKTSARHSPVSLVADATGPSDVAQRGAAVPSPRSQTCSRSRSRSPAALPDHPSPERPVPPKLPLAEAGLLPPPSAPAPPVSPVAPAASESAPADSALARGPVAAQDKQRVRDALLQRVLLRQALASAVHVAACGRREVRCPPQYRVGGDLGWVRWLTSRMRLRPCHQRVGLQLLQRALLRHSIQGFQAFGQGKAV